MKIRDWQSVLIDDIKADKKSSIAIGPFGSRMKSDCYVETGVPVIRGSNLTGGRDFSGDFVFITEEKADELASSNVFYNDLVFPHRGAIGEVGIIRKKKRYILSSSLMKLTCDQEKADPVFIYYFFKSERGRYELLKNSSQVGTPGIGQPLTSLKSVQLQLPSLVEQKAIAAILSAYDDKIELNRQMNATLEEMARALFKSWFVDFDPVRRNQEARLFGKSLASAAPYDHLFPDELVVDENGRELPKGWGLKTIPDIFEINPSRSLSKGESAPYLEMANMPTSSARAIDWRNRKYGSGMKFINGDVLLARITPCLENGKKVFVDFLAEEEVGWGSTEYIVFRSKAPLPPEYAYFFICMENLISHAIANMTGTSGRQRVPKEAFYNYPAVAPDAKVVNIFGEIAQTFFAQMKQNDEESHTLANLRDTLLPRLMSGQLRVPSTSPEARLFLKKPGFLQEST